MNMYLTATDLHLLINLLKAKEKSQGIHGKALLARLEKAMKEVVEQIKI